VFLPAPGLPRRADLAAAAEALNRGARVAMLVGAGALGATAEVLEAAELLASPIVKTLPGKAAVPDDHPLTTGGLGLLGTAPSEEVWRARTRC
jgi:pyruvate dehydrogenase (quinone)